LRKKREKEKENKWKQMNKIKDEDNKNRRTKQKILPHGSSVTARKPTLLKNFLPVDYA
jgi:hypothetical protein